MTSSGQAMDVDAAAAAQHAQPANAALATDAQSGPPSGALRVASQSDTRPTLDRIPDDVLLQIWILLDRPADLAQVSKRFHTASKDGFFRSKWLLTRYQLYEVIFEAIARPKLFSVDLFNRLRQGKAVLSRSLVQLLSLLRNPSSSTGQSKTRWGSAIGFKAYAAVIHEADRLFGDTVSLEKDSLDSYDFTRWLRRFEKGDGVDEQVRRLFNDGAFNPLPVTFVYSAASGNFSRTVLAQPSEPLKAILLQAIVKVPALAPLACANGYSYDFEESLWMCRWILAYGGSVEETFATLRQLQRDGVIRMTRTVASNVIAGMRGTLRPCGAHHHVELTYLNAYETLLMLDLHGCLDFNLEQVVEKVIQTWKGGAVDIKMVPFLKRLDKDFARIEISSMFIQAAFLQKEGTHKLEKIKTLMGRHADKVSSYEVLQASLRNKCNCTTAIKYALQYVDNFDVQAFVKELLDAILSQPYRGKMLRTLDSYFESEFPALQSANDTVVTVDFRKLLAEAIEKQAFSASELPAQRWKEAGRMEDASVRTLLALELGYSYCNGWGFHAVDSCEDENTPYLSNFTRFGHKHIEIASAGETQQPPATAEIDQDSVGLGKVEFTGIREHVLSSEDRSPRAALEAELRDAKEQRRCNIYGPRDSKYEHIADVIMEFFDSASKAADTLLSHAFVNGNESLVKDLINTKGVRLTLDHFKIAVQVSHERPGSEMPELLLEHIKRGASFAASFSAPDNEPDKQFLAQKKASAKLTQDELRSCTEVASIDEASRRFTVDIDQSGVMLVVSGEAVGSGIVQEIIGALDASSASAASSNKDVLMIDDTSSLSSLSSSGGKAEEKAAQLATADTSIAQRAKGLRRGARISYADDSDSDALESEGEPMSAIWSGIKSEDDQLIAQIDSVPTTMSRAERDHRYHVLNLWVSHLLVIRQREDRKHAAVKACSKPASGSSQRTAAHKHLSDVLIKGLRTMMTALENAKGLPTSNQDMSMLGELQGIWKDMDKPLGLLGAFGSKERFNDGWIKKFVQSSMQRKKNAPKVNRRTFQRSRFSKAAKDFEKTAEWKQNLRPLKDEDSADENFTAPLEQSDSDGEYSSDASSIVEPARKRIRTSTTTSSSSNFHADESGSDAAGESRDRRTRTQEETGDEGGSAVDGHDEDEENEADDESDQDPLGARAALRAFGTPEDTKPAIGNKAPSSTRNEQRHAVYSHPLFQRDDFERLWNDLKAEGCQFKSIAEDVMLESLDELMESYEAEVLECRYGHWRSGIFV